MTAQPSTRAIAWAHRQACEYAEHLTTQSLGKMRAELHKEHVARLRAETHREAMRAITHLGCLFAGTIIVILMATGQFSVAALVAAMAPQAPAVAIEALRFVRM